MTKKKIKQRFGKKKFHDPRETLKSCFLATCLMRRYLLFSQLIRRRRGRINFPANWAFSPSISDPKTWGFCGMTSSTPASTLSSLRANQRRLIPLSQWPPIICSQPTSIYGVYKFAGRKFFFLVASKSFRQNWNLGAVREEKERRFIWTEKWEK